MLTFAWYLLKVMLVSGIFFAYYLTALRNKKFHQYNRFYLLASTVLSWLIPLAKINFWQEERQNSQVIKLFTVVANGDAYVGQADRFKWDWNNMCIVIIAAISAIFLSQVIIALVRIKRLIAKNPGQRWDKVHLVFTNANGTPFSFFKYIFWNEQIDLQSSEGEQILKHELAHVNEKHSVDKLFLSFMLVIAWYNPFMWFIRKELNIIHEFIADKKAISDGDTSAFAQILLRTAFPAQSGILINSFFHSPIKRRLVMLTSNLNPRYSYLRRLMILPLLSVVMLFFAFTLKEKNLIGQHKQLENASLTSRQNETPAQFPGGIIEWNRYLERSLDLSVLKEHRAPVGSYAPVIAFTVNSDGSISNIVAETKAGYGTEEEAIQLIKKGPKWVPAKKDGVSIESKVKQAINFVLTDEGPYVTIGSTEQSTSQNLPKASGSTILEDTTKKKKNANVDATGNPVKILNITANSFPSHDKDSSTFKKALVIVDGKRLPSGDLNSIDPSQIQSVTVLKDASASQRFGEEGKNGVILITTKGQNPDQIKFEAQQKSFEVQPKNFQVEQKKFEVEQKKQEEQPKYLRVFTKVENPPYYTGGMAGFAEYINTNIKYPQEALQAKIEGAVLIQFIVNEEGKLTDFKKLSSKGYGLEEEAIRLLKNSGDWKPGVQNGHTVPVQIQQQVIFELPKKS